jgi:hypothetical protein
VLATGPHVDDLALAAAAVAVPGTKEGRAFLDPAAIPPADEATTALGSAEAGAPAGAVQATAGGGSVLWHGAAEHSGDAAEQAAQEGAAGTNAATNAARQGIKAAIIHRNHSFRRGPTE